MSSDAFLDAAAAIGRRIVAEAVWHGGSLQLDRRGGRAEASARGRSTGRSGRCVYDGTAGIGLFLAQLAAATGDADAAPHRGRRASSRARTRAGAAAGERDGLHAGTLGIALGGRARGRAARRRAARRRARAASPRGDRRARDARVPDVVTGAAGALVALLGLAAALDEPRPCRCRCRSARRCWRARPSAATAGRGRDPRTASRTTCAALAHGAGGIGWALLELFAATGDERFATARAGRVRLRALVARRETGTWPDLRLPARAALGRPGMTAHLVLRRGRHRAEPAARRRSCWATGRIVVTLTSRVETTRRHLAPRLPFAIDDLSLCHGAAGAAGRAPRRGRPRRRHGARARRARTPRGTRRLAVRRRTARRRGCSAGSAASAGSSCASTTRRSPSPLALPPAG